MQRSSIVVLACLAAACLSAIGCADPARQKLIGKWRVSVEMTDTDIGQMSAIENPLVAAFGRALFDSLRAAIELELREDGSAAQTFNALGTSIKRTGRWSFVGAAANEVTITSSFEDGTEPQQWKLRFQDDDTFQTVPHVGRDWQLNRLVTFRRVVER